MTLKPSHAAKRARTRYGVDMDELDEFEITSRIERGEAKRLHRTDNVAIYAVYWPKLGRTIPVVYETKRGFIVTVLPERRLTQGPRYYESETEEPLELDADFDALALENTPLSFLGDCTNPLMRERLIEAGLAR